MSSARSSGSFASAPDRENPVLGMGTPLVTTSGFTVERSDGAPQVTVDVTSPSRKKLRRGTTAKLTQEQRTEIEESQYNRKSFRFWRARIAWQKQMNPCARQFDNIINDDGEPENLIAFFMSDNTEKNVGQGAAAMAIICFIASCTTLAGSIVLSFTDHFTLGGVLVGSAYLVYFGMAFSNPIWDGFRSEPSVVRYNEDEVGTNGSSVLRAFALSLATPAFQLIRLLGYRYLWFGFHDLCLAVTR